MLNFTEKASSLNRIEVHNDTRNSIYTTLSNWLSTFNLKIRRKKQITKYVSLLSAVFRYKNDEHLALFYTYIYIYISPILSHIDTDTHIHTNTPTNEIYKPKWKSRSNGCKNNNQ